jgi:hypothetical protein
VSHTALVHHLFKNVIFVMQNNFLLINLPACTPVPYPEQGFETILLLAKH